MCRELLKISLLASLSLAIPATLTPTEVQAQNRVSYLGGSGSEIVRGIHRLSDSTVLISGKAANFDWVPAAVPRTVLTIPSTPNSLETSVTGINDRNSRYQGFILRLNKTMDTALALVHFPANTAGEIYKIRTNTAPGQATGDLWISGARDSSVSTAVNQPSTRQNGYYIAKLNNNFINGTPTGLTWTFDVRTENRRSNFGQGPYPANGVSDHKIWQPWDVQPDGKVLYVSGREFSDDFAEIRRLKLDGRTQDTVNGFPQHVIFSTDTAFGATIGRRDMRGAPQSISDMFRDSVDIIRLQGSGLANYVPATRKVKVDTAYTSSWVLKVNRPGGSNLRSMSAADYAFIQNDENGYPRQGRYPDDLYMNGPVLNANSGFSGPGPTGYSLQLSGNNIATQRCVALTVDKRNGDLYVGYATSVQSGRNSRDFDPAVVAMDANGRQKWWARLYRQDDVSTALQFVDFLEVDYTNNELLTVARTIGNDVRNFWNGDSITAVPGAAGYQNRFTGTVTDNVDIRWMGKLRLNNGELRAATYVGEPTAEAVTTSPVSANTLYDGWNDINVGNPNLANTSITAVALDNTGKVYIAGRSEGRVMTTRNAFFKSLKPDRDGRADSVQGATSFVRVYSSNLRQVEYSSLLTPVWDPVTGNEGDGVALSGILPTSNGLRVVGTHLTDNGTPISAQVPTVDTLTWGRSTPAGDAALVASLNFNCVNAIGKPDSIEGPTAICAGQTSKYETPAVAGATRYLWVTPPTGPFRLNGSRLDTTAITASALPQQAGTVRVVAIGACGVSEITGKRLDAPGLSDRPSAIQGPTLAQPHCVGTVRAYRATPALPGTTNYYWTLPAGWEPASGNPADTITTADSILVRATPAAVAGAMRVRANGRCGLSLPTSRNLAVPTAAPTAPAAITTTGTGAQCTGTNRIYTASTVTNVSGYIWRISGTGWTINNSTTTSVTVSPTAAALGVPAVLTVRSRNACDSSAVTTLNLDAAISTPVAPVIALTPPNILTFPTRREPGVTYQWLRNNSAIPNANDTFFVYTQGGNYSLRVTNACGNSTSNVLSNLVGLADNLATRFKMFPNPTQGAVTLEFETLSDRRRVAVIDLLGKRLQSLPAQEERVELNLSAYPDGVYFVEISDGNGRVVRKVNKQ